MVHSHFLRKNIQQWNKHTALHNKRLDSSTSKFKIIQSTLHNKSFANISTNNRRKTFEFLNPLLEGVIFKAKLKKPFLFSEYAEL